MHSRKRGNEKAARRRLARCALVPLPGPLGSQPLFGGCVQGSFPVPFRLLGSLDGEGAHQVQHWSLLSDSGVELSLTIIHGKINTIKHFGQVTALVSVLQSVRGPDSAPQLISPDVVM